ncbi:MAG: putative Ig domain-containing protein [Acidobacteriota bacterium]
MKDRIGGGWIALAFLLAAGIPVSGQSNQVVCSVSTAPVTVRAEGYAERVSDVVVTCTGGTPTPAQQTLQPMTFSLSANITNKSRVLAGSGSWSEALLLVDEPKQGNQFACAAVNGICTMTGAGGGATYSGPSAGRPNIFQGQASGNLFTWVAVPFDPPGPNGQRIFRFTNLRLQANAASLGAPLQVTVTATGQVPVVLQSGPYNVGASANSIAITTTNITGSGSRLSGFTLNFGQLIAGAFRMRTVGGTSAVDQSATGAPNSGTESGFYNPKLIGAAARGDLSTAGLADTGTRFRIKLTGIPTDALIIAPQTVLFGNGELRLTAATSQGGGAFSFAPSTILSNVNGAVTAVYEVSLSNPAATDTVTIPFSISYTTTTAQLTRIQGEAAIAPDTPASATDIPNFLHSVPLDILLPLGFTTSTLPAGSVGVAYTGLIQATGGVSPYAFTMAVGGAANNLPPGLTLLTTGALSGMPTTTGTFAFNVTVLDANKNAVTKAFSVTVSPTLSFVTASPLPSPTVGVPYSTQIEVSGGTGPYTYGFLGNPPQGFSLVAGGVGGQGKGIVTLGGTPTTTGVFSFTVQVTDSAQVTVAKVYSFTVIAAGTIGVSASSLTFTAIQGGDLPPQQVLTVLSDPQSGATFVVAMDAGIAGSAAPAWLLATPATGVIPGRIAVSPDQGTLPVGTYTGRLRITIRGTTNAPVDVAITLNIVNQPPKVEAWPRVVSFLGRFANPGKQTADLFIRNTGGGGAIAYSGKILRNSAWVTGFTPAQGSATPRKTTVIKVTIDTTGLAIGFYRDAIRFTSSVGTYDVPILLYVAPAGPYLELSSTGLRFQQQVGAADTRTRTVKVLNRAPQSTLNWSAEVLKGSDWLVLSGASGTSTLTSPGSFSANVKLSAVNLPAGTNYGLIRVNAPGALNGPQFVVVVLNVFSTAEATDFEFDESGAVLTMPPFSTTPTTRTFNLTLGYRAPTAVRASASTSSGGDWLRVSQDKTNVSYLDVLHVTVSLSTQILGVGVYRGEISIVTGTTLRTMNITLIVANAVGDVPSSRLMSDNAGPKATGCTPDRLVITSTGLADTFAVAAGWPNSLSVDLRDSCGTAVTNASVVASFTNGDPPLSLLGDDNTGVYSASWQPGTDTSSMNILFRADSADFPEELTVLTGGVSPNAAPVLFDNGIVNNDYRKLGGSLASGTVAEVYGANLASVTESTGTVPLPMGYKGTDILVGPNEAALFFVTPTQVNVQLPVELAPNQPAWVIAISDSGISNPVQIRVVPFQPGVAAFEDPTATETTSRTLIVQHAVDYSLVTASNPAKRGEFLTMYLIGLGPVTPSVATGAPAPSAAPFSIPNTVPTMTIDNQQVDVAFVGQVPGGVGLFQINFKVPDNARLNTPLDVVVSQGGVAANVTGLTVAQ